MLDDLTIEDIAGFERPARDEVEAYWAARPISDRPLRLPYRLIRHPWSARVFIDAEEGWLWVTLPFNGYGRRLTCREEFRPHFPRELEANGTDVFGTLSVLGRRRIGRDQARTLVAEAMPDLAAYQAQPGAPEPTLLEILRAGGWEPWEAAHAAWRLESPEDARVLAAHTPHWWERHGWRATVGDAEHRFSFTGRDLERLAASPVPFGAFKAAVDAGWTDVEQITALRPPTLPDDATRVVFLPNTAPSRPPGRLAGWVYSCAAHASHALEQNPSLWLDTVQVDTDPGLHLVHASQWRPGWSVWSDGTLQGRAHGGPDHGDYRVWRRGFAELDAVEPLIDQLSRADNVDQVDGALLWGRWWDATGFATATVEHVETSRSVDIDTTVTRILTVEHHTVAVPGGTVAEAWTEREEYRRTPALDGLTPVSGPMDAQLTVHTDPNAALTAHHSRIDDLPPVTDAEETAALLGLTPDAFKKARERSMRPSSTLPRLAEPITTTGGRGKMWWNPRAALAWQAGRPGKGGRPRRSPRR